MIDHRPAMISRYTSHSIVRKEKIGTRRWPRTTRLRTNWVKDLSATAIVTVSVLFAVVAVEMYARYAKPTAYQNDKELGWKLLPNVNITFNNLRFDQTEYKALITTNELGLRESGSKENPQLTILILGDSFTADSVAGNEEM